MQLAPPLVPHGLIRLIASLQASYSTSAMPKVELYEPLVDLDEHAAKAWEFFRGMGSPKFHVAPMVDQVGADVSTVCNSHNILSSC
jgi:hypothetical protein